MGFWGSVMLEKLRDLGWCLWREYSSIKCTLVNDLFDDCSAKQYSSNMERNCGTGNEISSSNGDFLFAPRMIRKTSDIPNLLVLDLGAIRIEEKNVKVFEGNASFY